ncbi:hypothetical protein DB321_03710 [Ligilactobacillus salivarius]|uniref:Uncharacterized protein n=2 Tax=Ligilactobacillus salivarius TaxID=1624 RepID=A0A1V9QY28_9LACO|nr:hypothetical protein [Ligilactobacillus salivarius]ATP37641.1 hypothetical protein CR531_05780 [Ligilactobacillus salivarius]EEJ74869.1 hypothetical protein HMPREF0545_0009 [Ligilactobacillus salivarius DSM 20555 = ATCC 11741]KRM70332.1 hypothetical protein FC55_GL001166 [Ligilactobacillus salivarius DSM 20555 = ATCC 11741]MBE7937582.1 hypothetical protein [Ligilactobacillus salivarius]MBL1057878.1 hypothetical protein [Ligilactobacillus salivarius]
MGATILLNKKLKEAWIGENKGKNSEIKENNNLKALRKKEIINIEEYYQKILEKVNERNSKYNVDSINFVDEPLPFLSKQALNAGKIVKYVKDEEKTLAYVYISNPSLGSRNIFGAQQLFPGLSYLINYYISSPAYEFANLPIYFINGSIDPVTESMQETIMAMNLMNIRYIQLFDDNKLPDGIFEGDLIKFSRFISNDTVKRPQGIIYTDFYVLDYKNKKIKFTTSTFKEDNISSFGSSDRFFVIKAYPALLLADEEMYDIDVTEIQRFLSVYGKGRNNLEPFISFAKKLKERERF